MERQQITCFSLRLNVPWPESLCENGMVLGLDMVIYQNTFNVGFREVFVEGGKECGVVFGAYAVDELEERRRRGTLG